jgi:hypothetical protein
VDLSSVNKRSPRDLAISAVFFSCIGGIEFGWSIQSLIHARLRYTWTGELLMGSAFIALGIFYAVMLVRRVGSSADAVSPQHY